MLPEEPAMRESESIRAVRRRLWRLLLRAFGTVVLLIILFMLAVTYISLELRADQNPFYRAPVAYLLETYYAGHGSWQGVDTLFDQQGVNLPFLRREWTQAVLLDPSGVVLVDQGQINTARVGEILPDGLSNATSLQVGGQTVGALLFESSLLNTPRRLVLELLPTIAVASILLGLLTVVIGLLLMRRVVEPLSTVIAAAQAVAGGDLGARVPTGKRHDDLYALSTSFNRMASELERNDRQRREMLADIAHELRTPLTILRGRLEGILDGVYTADEAHIAPALEEVYLLERLVDDLRLLTLVEARQLPLEPRPFDLAELAQRVATTFEAQAAESGVRLYMQSMQEALPVNADPQRIEQVIGNLIGNALRYVPPGGLVNIWVSAQEGRAQLSVVDNGPGVAPEDLEHIFDRFWRGDKSRARNLGGAGLGLAISRQLIEAHGGTIWANNLEHGGFQVSFELPSQALSEN